MKIPTWIRMSSAAEIIKNSIHLKHSQRSIINIMREKRLEKRNHKAIYDQNWKELQDEHRREKNMKISFPWVILFRKKTRGEGEGWISKFPPDLLNYFQSIRNAGRYNSSLSLLSSDEIDAKILPLPHATLARSGRRKGGLIFFRLRSITYQLGGRPRTARFLFGN